MDSLEGRPYKITCVRFNLDAGTKRMMPSYYIMMSRGWKVRFGAWAREPFERVFKNPFKGVEVPDIRMDEMVRAMKARGWDRLPEIKPEHVDINRLAKVERMAQSDPEIAYRTRYLTVQIDDIQKMVSYEDAVQLGEAMRQAYVDCEHVALKGAMQHTVQITTETIPLPFK